MTLVHQALLVGTLVFALDLRADDQAKAFRSIGRAVAQEFVSQERVDVLLRKTLDERYHNDAAFVLNVTRVLVEKQIKWTWEF